MCEKLLKRIQMAELVSFVHSCVATTTWLLLLLSVFDKTCESTLLLNYTITENTAAWDKTVIIVTGGRMGSTLVSGLVTCGIEPGCGTPENGRMNANPDVFMGGENYLALWRLFEFEQDMVHAYRLHRSNAGINDRGGVSNPWYHTVNPASLKEQIMMLVQSYFVQDMTKARVVGFKEVRWYQKSETRPTKKKPQTTHSAKSLRDFIMWIHRYVPNLHVVFNLRNAEDTSQSGWWKGQKGSIDVIRDLTREILEVYEGLKKLRANSNPNSLVPKVVMLDYDNDILNQNVSHLYECLDETYNHTLVESVLGAKFSSSSSKKKHKI